VFEFQDSGILLKLFTWIRDVSNKYDSLSWANLEIWREFKKHGITIPFPQRDVYIKEQ
jgi:small-conductance mechanosensitive channel